MRKFFVNRKKQHGSDGEDDHIMARHPMKTPVHTPLKNRRKKGKYDSPTDVTYLPVKSKKGNIPHRLHNRGLAHRRSRRA